MTEQEDTLSAPDSETTRMFESTFALDDLYHDVRSAKNIKIKEK